MLHQHLPRVAGVDLSDHGSRAVPHVPTGSSPRAGGHFAESPGQLPCVLRGGDHDGADAAGFVPASASSVLRDSGDEH